MRFIQVLMLVILVGERQTNAAAAEPPTPPAAATTEQAAEEADLVCECADPDCGHRLEVPIDDYERVRADGTRFVVAPGHEEPSFERVVERRSGFRIVAKFRDGLAQAVQRLNPRADTA